MDQGVQALFPCELVLPLQKLSDARSSFTSVENLQPELFGFALFLLSGGFFGCVSPVTLSLWLVLQGPLHIRVTWGRELASTSSSSQAGSRWSHGGDVSQNKTELKGCKCASGLASEPLLPQTPAWSHTPGAGGVLLQSCWPQTPARAQAELPPALHTIAGATFKDGRFP